MTEPEAHPRPHRFGLYFANCGIFADTVTGTISERPALRAVVIDAAACRRSTTSVWSPSPSWTGRCATRGGALHVASAHGPITDVIARLPDGARLIAEGRMHTCVEVAVRAAGLPADSPLNYLPDDTSIR